MKRLLDETDHEGMEEKIQKRKRPKPESATRLILHDGAATVPYTPSFLSRNDADRYFSTLLASTQWNEERIKIMGRELPAPRLVFAYGDAGVSYMYAGVRKLAHSWNESILGAKRAVEAFTGLTFNYALLNLYRDGRDCIGWHSDDESDLIENHVIASVSLGAERDFLLKRKKSDVNDDEADEDPMLIKTLLGHGSLLLMMGDTQRRYKHCVPRRARCRMSRINITFRQVLVADMSTL